MTPLNLLLILASRGVALIPREGKLVVDAPAGALSEWDREMLARHKTELLALLTDAAAPDALPPDWHLLWDERAAIMEYEGGFPRERAEALALAAILSQMHAARRAAYGN
jgi:hypothetical protein